jgi:CRP/FNR family transcriptional regulator
MAYDVDEHGVERIYNFMEAGSLVLECNALMRKPAIVWFKTLVPSEFKRITRAELLAAMAADPELNMDIIESITDKFLGAMDSVRNILKHDVQWRMCNLLLIFADRYGELYDGKVLICEHISQQTIANLLCINRVTAVRAIRELRDLALIEQVNGLYCIRDVSALKRHMEATGGADR